MRKCFRLRNTRDDWNKNLEPVLRVPSSGPKPSIHEWRRDLQGMLEMWCASSLLVGDHEYDTRAKTGGEGRERAIALNEESSRFLRGAFVCHSRSHPGRLGCPIKNHPVSLASTSRYRNIGPEAKTGPGRGAPHRRRRPQPGDAPDDYPPCRAARPASCLM